MQKMEYYNNQDSDVTSSNPPINPIPHRPAHQRKKKTTVHPTNPKKSLNRHDDDANDDEHDEQKIQFPEYYSRYTAHYPPKAKRSHRKFENKTSKVFNELAFLAAYEKLKPEGTD